MCIFMIRKISRWYESDIRGAATISQVNGDPGWKSYEFYQLSSKSGTLQKFLKFFGYAKQFPEEIGSDIFDARWKQLSKMDIIFIQAQLQFIEQTYFKPLTSYVEQKGIKRMVAIDEDLFSISVQHENSKEIVNNALKKLKLEFSTIDIINALYDA